MCSGPLVAFEIVLDAVPEPRAAHGAPAGARRLRPHAVTRDFAFVVDDSVEAEKLVKAVRGRRQAG